MKKRTGGPNTEHGKLVASKNALKTGVYSSLTLLPNESQEDFQTLRDQFIKDFQPGDAVEINLLEDLVEIAWKQYRLRNIEHQYLIQKLNQPFQDSEVADCQQLCNPIVRQYLFALDLSDKEMDAYSREYDLAEKLISKDTYTDKDYKPIIESYLYITQYLKNQQLLLRVSTLDGATLLNAVVNEKLILDGIENVESNGEVVPTSFGAYVLNKVIESLEGIFHIRAQSDVIKQEIRYVKNERYMKLMQSETYIRAYEDLRRAFSRALQELRKHQEWKLRTQSIEMTVPKIYKTD